VRKGKKGAWWAQVESTGKERALFIFQVPLKPTLPHGRTGPGGSHPIMNKWRGAWVVPSQVRVVWSFPRQHARAPNFSYFEPASNSPLETIFQKILFWGVAEGDDLFSVSASS
jgi:hypothetical protein